MEKLTENMIRWAESKLGNTEYAGWCLAFIEDALEISNNIEVFGGDSAKESCEMYKDALQTGIPERGAFVFYDCLCPSENGPVNWGHCGISFGDGRVLHAWDVVRVDDYLAIEKLTALTGDHPKYLGWVALERVLNQKPYYYNWPAQLKTVVDRFYSYTTELTGMRKKTALISAAWDSTDTVFAVVDACLNYNESFCPKQIEAQAICLDGDAYSILHWLDEGRL